MSTKQNTPLFECELKLHLETAADHVRLEKRLRHFSSPDVKEQVNIFFDTEDQFLRNQKIALRLRQEGAIFLLTAKGRKIQTGDLVVRPEIECEISLSEGLSLLQKKKNIAELNHPPLLWIKQQTNRSELCFHEVLRFTNQRQNFILPDCSFVLELDHTLYENGTHFFELEVEFQNEADYLPAKKILQKIFNEENLPWKISAQSKYARALTYK